MVPQGPLTSPPHRAEKIERDRVGERERSRERQRCAEMCETWDRGREKVSIRLLIAKTDNVSLWTFSTSAYTHVYPHTNPIREAEEDTDTFQDTFLRERKVL